MKSLYFYFHSFFISLIKRFRGRLGDRLGTAVNFFASFTRATFSTFLILYTEIPFNLIRLFLKCFFRLFKSYF